MIYQVLESRRLLPFHPLFGVAKDLYEITSPCELGYHPDTVLSVFDYFDIQPKQMPASGVRGEDFIAIRCAPVDEYDMTHVKVECVYLRNVNEKWTARKLNQTVSDDEFQVFTKLAQNEPVKMGDRIWKRI